MPERAFVFVTMRRGAMRAAIDMRFPARGSPRRRLIRA
jgi:hypothetical protein